MGRRTRLSPRRWSVAGLAAALAVVSLPAGVGFAVAGPAPALAATVSSACQVPAGASDVVATPVPGSATDWNLTSFDGTRIRLHWFPVAGATAAHPAPTILMGPGWGESGDIDTTTTSTGLFAFVTIRQLWDNGYNVLTWDPRGFGQSGGSAEVDSPTVEGRDMERIISWVATRPGAQLDRPGEPRLGMVGVSYGAGIQLTTAAVDCRVDAIVPTWSWHSLTTSLDKGNITKNGWSGVLYAALAGRPVDPHLVEAHQQSLSTGLIGPSERAWFAQRGPGQLVDRIRAPTLFVQGEEDDLFTLDEAITNYGILRHDDVPTAMVWMCGGHGVCLTSPGNPQLVADRTLAWLDRYVKRDRSVDIGPRFTFVDQDGVTYSASEYPLPTVRSITADAHGTFQLTAGGGSGPAHPPADSGNPLAPIAGPVTPARAAHAFNVDVPVGARSGLVVGAPQLRITYRGTTPAGSRPTRLFAQIVDDTSDLVLDNQITPIVVTLDGRQHTASVSLESIAYHAEPGAHLTLQLVATTVAYAQPRLGGTVRLEQVHLALPVVSGATPG
jgi:ABC-2 type transport system ATP-binding protein